ncbi:ABC transporter permease [Flavobacteriales bacterium]|nr:ABC transporter permease [Flavobacteriales bacterium]
MNVPFYIARKYFFSSKKINYVHILSLVSQFGIAIGTIALVLVMSVFNGFENLVLDMYNVFDPHIRVTSNEGKNFDSDEVNKVIGDIDGVANFSSVLEEKILVEYNSKQYIAVIKGVDENYRELTNFDSLIVDGGYIDDFKNNNVAMVGRGIAYYLSMHIGSVFDNLRVYLPNRDSKNLLKLEKAFTSSSISPVGVFGVQQEIDSKYIIVPLNFVQDLINRDKYVSAIEIKLKSSDSMINIQNLLKEKLDSKYLIQNRFEQQEFLYKILNTERLVVVIILLFIVLIASFNIISSLIILIIDKKKDIESLFNFGVENNSIKQVFIYKSMLGVFVGSFSGIIIGFILAYLQQEFGLIKMGAGSFVIDAYPVSIKLNDIIIIQLIVLLIGLLASWFTSRLMLNRV